jgi:hypothetical protein
MLRTANEIRLSTSASELQKHRIANCRPTDQSPKPRESPMPESEKGKWRAGRIAKELNEKLQAQPIKPEPKANSANPIVCGVRRKWENAPDENQAAEDARFVEHESQERLKDGYGHQDSPEDDGAGIWRDKARRCKQERRHARREWICRKLECLSQIRFRR